MADTTTELEVLDEIVDVLGGQSGQYETVVPTLQQIRDLLGGGGGRGGYNPSLSVGRADALTGADSTAQWATRESTGSGSAIVRSVQGAAVVWNQYAPLFSASIMWAPAVGAISEILSDGRGFKITSNTSNVIPKTKNTLTNMVPIPNDHTWYIACTVDATGTMTNPAFGLYNNVSGSGAFRVIATAGVAGRYSGIGVASTSEQLLLSVRLANATPQGGYATFSDFIAIDLTAMFGAGNEPTTVAEFEAMYPEPYYPYSAPTLKPVQIAGIASTDAQGGELDSVEWTAQTLRAAGIVRDELTAGELVTRVGSRAYQSGDESDSSVITDGTTTFYALAEPTTTPISPALPMTYRVEQSGSESVIVPTGEISATPIITVAEGESAAELVMDALAAIAAPDGPTATANHAINTYLTMGGKLYKVTSAIAVGESITPNTNVTETTVMAELVARTA